MNCGTCDHEAVPHDPSTGQVGEVFTRISWELVDLDEYYERIQDGRASWLSVCPKCYKKYTGNNYRPISEVLHELNEKRKEMKR